MELEFINNQEDLYENLEDDMSQEAQMQRIETELTNIRAQMQSVQIYDYQNPAKLMKQKFTHFLKIHGIWNMLEIDDEHKKIFFDRLSLIKVGLRGGVTKVENAKKGDKEDIRIYWK